jgi:hypothetical protein
MTFLREISVARSKTGNYDGLMGHFLKEKRYNGKIHIKIVFFLGKPFS